MRLTRWQVEILGFEVARELVRAGLAEGQIKSGMTAACADTKKSHWLHQATERLAIK